MLPSNPIINQSKKSARANSGSAETIGQRLARLRRERGLTQVMLADSVGIIQALVSDYERDKLRLNRDISVKFAQALGVTTDQLQDSIGRRVVLLSRKGFPVLRWHPYPDLSFLFPQGRPVWDCQLLSPKSA